MSLQCENVITCAKLIPQIKPNTCIWSTDNKILSARFTNSLCQIFWR